MMPPKGRGVDMEFADPEDAIPRHEPISEPERRLWFAVLECAFRDATSSGRGKERTAHWRNEARAWFASTETGPCSLAWIVEQTGIAASAAALRERIK